MEGFFRRYRNALVLIAVLLVQIIFLATQMRRPDYGGQEDGHHVRVFRLWMNVLVSPPEKLLASTGHGIRNLWHSYIDLRHTRTINNDLQRQLNEMRLREAALAEDARQGQRLRTLLEFREHYIAKTVAAQVIGTSGVDNAHILNIDKGRNDGLRPDMAVITPDGIVGKLRNVYPGTAEVLLISDPSSGAGVILENTRLRGVLHGSVSGIPEITNLLPDNRIHPGDGIVTSGGDRVFPRGLKVGNVQSIAPDPEHQPYTAIIVRPATNLDRLEEVLIITDTSTTLAGGPPQDLSPADADALKRASQIVAEHLPGLHEPGEAIPETKPGPPAPAVIPKPAPVLHLDRYSPGAAPPAADLKPGASHANDPAPQPRTTSPAGETPKKEPTE
jgi:rod shape-determining protein MreC